MRSMIFDDRNMVDPFDEKAEAEAALADLAAVPETADRLVLAAVPETADRLVLAAFDETGEPVATAIPGERLVIPA